jgi:hypothetical protein
MAVGSLPLLHGAAHAGHRLVEQHPIAGMISAHALVDSVELLARRAP